MRFTQKTKRRILVACAVIFVGVGSYAWALLAPQSLFRHALIHRNIIVRAESPVDSGWRKIIDKSLSLVQKSELYTDECELTVLLVRDSMYRRLESPLARPVMAKASRNIVFLNAEIDLERNRLIGPVLEMDLVRTLAHEMTHCLENARYGFVTALGTPPWKREGYAEYISHAEDRKASSYSIDSLLALIHKYEAAVKEPQWIDIHDGMMVPVHYTRYRLLVEYLMDSKGMSYVDIVDSDLSEIEVYNELVKSRSDQ